MPDNLVGPPRLVRIVGSPVGMIGISNQGFREYEIDGVYWKELD